MQRREFLKSAMASMAVEPERPNFLVLIADDLTHRGIHRLGNPEIQTPNLDRLADNGCLFTHCFHQGSWLPAVCVASRSMLNSGLSAFRVKQRIETTPLWGESLAAHGYETAIVGKWHLSRGNLDRSFHNHGPVAGGMFESGPSAYLRPSPGNTWAPWDKSLGGQWQRAKLWQKAAGEEIKHSAQIWAENASEYLLGRTNQKNPFFLYVGFTSPHDPRQAPKEYVDRYPMAGIEIPPNYLPVHPFDQGDREIRDEVLAPFPRSREAVQLHRSEYYAHVTYMDTQIGQILKALDKSGQAKNTYVIFTADHGLAVGQHGLMGKQNMYDHSIRIPLIISGPGVPKGSRVDQLVYQHSLFPTTCELARLPRNSMVEFPSVADLLTGSGGEKHDAVFSYYRNFQRAVRTKEYKLIVYPQAGVTQLFNVDKDPWETKDLGQDRSTARLRRDLLQRLHQLQRELGDDLPAAGGGH